MAGMLPGVEVARRRRFHQSGIGGIIFDSQITSSSTTGYGYGMSSRRSSFCLYTSNHEFTHLGSLSSSSSSSSSMHRSTQSKAYCYEKLGDAAREAKERLDERLNAQWKSSSSSSSSETKSSSGQQRSRNYVQIRMESSEEKKKKSRTKRFCWGKLSWKSSTEEKEEEEEEKEEEKCVVCLEKYKVGDKILELPCEHRFHSSCLIPWIGKNQHCPCCRMDLSEFVSQNNNNNNYYNKIIILCP